MAKPSRSGLKRLIKAAVYSWFGLRAAFQYETAFRLELALFVVLAPAGLWLGQTGVERAVLIGSLLIVLIIELVNSGIEAIVDRVGDEYHDLSGRAKDLGSAAVFVSIANVVIVWMLVVFEQL